MSKLYINDLSISNSSIRGSKGNSGMQGRKCPACGEFVDEPGDWLQLLPHLIICPACAYDLALNLPGADLDQIDRRLS